MFIHPGVARRSLTPSLEFAAGDTDHTVSQLSLTVTVLYTEHGFVSIVH